MDQQTKILIIAEKLNTKNDTLESRVHAVCCDINYNADVQAVQLKWLGNSTDLLSCLKENNISSDSLAGHQLLVIGYHIADMVRELKNSINPEVAAVFRHSRTVCVDKLMRNHYDLSDYSLIGLASVAYGDDLNFQNVMRDCLADSICARSATATLSVCYGLVNHAAQKLRLTSAYELQQAAKRITDEQLHFLQQLMDIDQETLPQTRADLDGILSHAVELNIPHISEFFGKALPYADMGEMEAEILKFVDFDGDNPFYHTLISLKKFLSDETTYYLNIGNLGIYPKFTERGFEDFHKQLDEIIYNAPDHDLDVFMDDKYITEFDALLDSKINQAQELLERTLHLYAQACHHVLSPHACGL